MPLSLRELSPSTGAFAAVPGHVAEQSLFLIPSQSSHVLLGAGTGLSSARCPCALCWQRRSWLRRPRRAGASRCSPTDGLHFNGDDSLHGPVPTAAACSHLCNKPLSLLLLLPPPWVQPHGAVGSRAVVLGSAWPPELPPPASPGCREPFYFALGFSAARSLLQ